MAKISRTRSSKSRTKTPKKSATQKSAGGVRAKKVTTKKAAPRKGAGKKITSKKAVSKKSAVRKTVSKKPATPKSRNKKLATKKTRAVKVAPRRTARASSSKKSAPTPSAWQPFFNIVLAVLIAAGILGVLWHATEFLLAERFFPGVQVLGREVGLQTRAALTQDLRAQVAEFSRQPFLLKFGEQEHAVLPRELGIEISIADTVKNAFLVGHQGALVRQLRERWTALRSGRAVPLSVKINEDKLRLRLEQVPELRPPRLSDLVKFGRGGQAQLQAEIPDFHRADVAAVAAELRRASEFLQTKTLEIPATDFTPQIAPAELSELSQTMTDWSQRQIELVYRLNHYAETFELDFGGDPAWFVLREVSDEAGNSRLKVVLSENKIDKFLSEAVAPKINRERVDAEISLGEDGSVQVAGQALAGLALDFDATRQLIFAALQNSAERVAVPVKIEKPRVIVAPEIQKKYGIMDLLATGWSDFSYSSYSRVNNIKVGLRKFDGLLLAPGATFSFNKNLGYVGSATGFLPEIVIKGTENVPEFGGGLCQVSTTHYRAALLAGLPITQRRSHGYHVFHYEPAGSDATIYLPAPDLRFVNDTDGFLLIQTWTAPNNIDAFVNIYGHDDGRRVRLEGPWKSRFRRPGAPVIVPTADLPPGKRRIKDYQIFGFDALWKRYIRRADGTETSEEISSRYAAWPAVILEGIAR